MEIDTIRYRHNVMNINSLSAFIRIKGGYINGCRDVYFVRMTGASQTLISDIQNMDCEFDSSMKQGDTLYKRIEKLPVFSSREDVDFYSSCYKKWIDEDKKKIIIRSTDKNDNLAEALSNAIKEVDIKFSGTRGNINESIRKNFIVKILYWFDGIMQELVVNWNVKSCIKLVASNVVKEQEYLFFYLLTLIGTDVLLIQNKCDIQLSKTLMELSTEVNIGGFVEWDIPKYQKKNENPTEKISSNPVKKAVPKPVCNPVQNSDAARLVRVGKSKTENSLTNEKSFEQLALLASSVVMIAIHDKNGEIVGSGSGIMIGKDGYILTNFHVVKNGCFFSVRIEDDENIYPTDEIIKYNSVLDMAIIRIDKELHPLPVYNSGKELVRGQKVVAIGSPMGLFNSVSDGIISGFRDIDGVNMIQFTAPISHGSSGGAVLNMYGEVIGMSTAGIDNAQNINLAVGYKSINQFVGGFVHN